MSLQISWENPNTPVDKEPFLVSVSAGTSHSFALDAGDLREISKEAFVRLNQDAFILNGDFGGKSSKIVIRWVIANDGIEVLTFNAHHVSSFHLEQLHEDDQSFLRTIRKEIESKHPDWAGEAIYLVANAYAKVNASYKEDWTGLLEEDRDLYALEINLGNTFSLIGPKSTSRSGWDRVLILWGTCLRDEVEIKYDNFVWPVDLPDDIYDRFIE